MSQEPRVALAQAVPSPTMAQSSHGVQVEAAGDGIRGKAGNRVKQMFRAEGWAAVQPAQARPGCPGLS